jgi:hypothetical protein
VKKLVLAVGCMAVATSTAWALNGGSPNVAYGQGPGFYYDGGPYAAPQPASLAYYGFDPTAHYWDYYRLDLGHGIDVDQTTRPE